MYQRPAHLRRLLEAISTPKETSRSIPFHLGLHTRLLLWIYTHTSRASGSIETQLLALSDPIPLPSRSTRSTPLPIHYCARPSRLFYFHVLHLPCYTCLLFGAGDSIRRDQPGLPPPTLQEWPSKPHWQHGFMSRIPFCVRSE
jgi:hypothetical protein